MSLHVDASAEMRAWSPPNAAQAKLRDAFVDNLDSHADGVWRTCAPAHLTASAVILDPIQRAILLVLHRKVGRWLQPGGHCEIGDASLGAAALREGSEAAGVAGLELLSGILHI